MSFGISKGGSETSSSNSNETLSNLFSSLQQTLSTGTSTGSTTQNGSTSGSNRRVVSQDQSQIGTQLAQLLKNISADPKSFVAPSQNAAREEVNGNYSGVGDSLREQFLAGGGGGQSGKYGKAALASDLARRSSLSKVDNDAAIEASKLPLTAAQLMQQFLGIDYGYDTSGSSTGGSTSTGTTTEAGTSNTSGTTDQTRVVDTTGKTNKGIGFNAGI
jgi:hypothetical protein